MLLGAIAQPDGGTQDGGARGSTEGEHSLPARGYSSTGDQLERTAPHDATGNTGGDLRSNARRVGRWEEIGDDGIARPGGTGEGEATDDQEETREEPTLRDVHTTSVVRG